MAIPNAPLILERDLTVHQRNLVDTCFEEGQYDAAISVLEELLSPKIKPFPPHIRQLIYLALYPPPTIDDEAEEEALRLEPGSPSKILSRRHKSSLTPSTKVSDAAQDLLDKFARVNTPESLACALPSYPDDPRERSDARLEDEDSYIARRALRVRDARCCWELLKEGFIERSDSEAAPSPQKPRRRRTSTRISANEPDSDEDGTAALGLVSERGWGMLAWMVTLFERDEEAVESTGEVRYSPLLLSQIPPSRSNSAARWDVEMPLDIAFCALEQENTGRRASGLRLIASLINLSCTLLVDLPMFLKAVSTRVSSLSHDALAAFFADLPSTRAILQFKLLLCRHALGGGGPAHTSSAAAKPKPQARARAQPRRRAPRDSADPGVATHPGADDTHEGEASLGAREGTGAGGPLSVARRPPSMPASEVLTLVARPEKADAGTVLTGLCYKAELVSGYHRLQRALGESRRDPAWPGIVRDGALRRAVEGALKLDACRGAGAMGALDAGRVQAYRVRLLGLVTMLETQSAV